MVDIEQKKRKFLRQMKVNRSNKERRVWSNCLRASTSTRKYSIYVDNVSHKRKLFHKRWEYLVSEISSQYKTAVCDEEHCENIVLLSKTLSCEYGELLVSGRLRIGSAQKSLNLYLKYLWCFGEIDAPPHCTIDRKILLAGKIMGNWTECDSIDEYKRWIGGLRKVASRDNFGTLVEWELCKYEP